jgi:predicted nucleic-acid-binding Zn-ribbon protein
MVIHRRQQKGVQKMSNQGLDYSRFSSTVNRNAETGIRYGVISTHSLGEGFYDSQEMDYGDPTCPKCGNTAIDSGDDRIPATDDREDWDYKGNDYACIDCKSTFWSDACYSDEPLGWHIDDGDYKVVDCLDSDAMVIESPYFTYAAFCSQCLPGACSLDSPIEPDNLSAKCYCFGHEWFDGGVAPYTVYSVETGEVVLPEEQPCKS